MVCTKSWQTAVHPTTTQQTTKAHRGTWLDALFMYGVQSPLFNISFNAQIMLYEGTTYFSEIVIEKAYTESATAQLLRKVKLGDKKCVVIVRNVHAYPKGKKISTIMQLMSSV